MTRRGDMSQLSERGSRAKQGAPQRDPAQPRERSGPARPTPAGSPPRGDAVASLRDSLASTDEGLKRFLEVLRQSGLSESMHGYHAMQMVLVQQRLWAHAHRRTDLLPLFQSLARTTTEIHRIFSGFAAVMLPLKDLDKLSKMTGVDPEPDAAADAPAAVAAAADAPATDAQAADAPAADAPAAPAPAADARSPDAAPPPGAGASSPAA
jgi:hypothetical protein